MFCRDVMLNTNVYGRPFDNLQSRKVFEEAVACCRIFQLAAAGEIDITSSDVLFAEISLISDALKKKAVFYLVSQFSGSRMELNDKIVGMADLVYPAVRDFMDCLHLAFAAVGNCCLVTCDRELQEKAFRIEKLLSVRGLKLRIMSPAAFLAEMNHDGE